MQPIEHRTRFTMLAGLVLAASAGCASMHEPPVDEAIAAPRANGEEADARGACNPLPDGVADAVWGTLQFLHAVDLFFNPSHASIQSYARPPHVPGS